MPLKISECFNVLRRPGDTWRFFEFLGEGQYIAMWWAWFFGVTRMKTLSDSKDFKNSPRNFMTLKGFQISSNGIPTQDLITVLKGTMATFTDAPLVNVGNRHPLPTCCSS